LARAERWPRPRANARLTYMAMADAHVYMYIHRDRKKNGPPKQNAVKCTIYNTI